VSSALSKTPPETWRQYEPIFREHSERGPWYALRSCWFNSLYTRVVPSHAVELTSAHLDRRVAATLGSQGIADATPEHRPALRRARPAGLSRAAQRDEARLRSARRAAISRTAVSVAAQYSLILAVSGGL
jgi:hypothetical protein